MTIFLVIAKRILDSRLSTILNASIKQDGSVSNHLLKWVGFGRDEELSEGKKALLLKLKLSISRLEDATHDQETLTLLKKMITDTKAQAKTLAEEGKKLWGEGDFGPEMLKLANFLDEIYTKLHAVTLGDKPQLIDFKHDSDPLNQYRYTTALYLGLKTTITFYETTFDRLKQNPQLVDIRAVAAKKEALLIEGFLSCVRDVSTLNEDHANYSEAKQHIVVESMQHVRTQNRDLCDGKAIHVNLLLGELKLPLYKPGMLEDGLLETIRAITAPKTASVEKQHPLAEAGKAAAVKDELDWVDVETILASNEPEAQGSESPAHEVSETVSSESEPTSPIANPAQPPVKHITAPSPSISNDPPPGVQAHANKKREDSLQPSVAVDPTPEHGTVADTSSVSSVKPAQPIGASPLLANSLLTNSTTKKQRKKGSGAHSATVETTSTTAAQHRA